MTSLVPIGTSHVNLLFEYFCSVATKKPELVGSTLARLLRERREEAGLSMNVVATRAGLSHTMISRIERELRKPTLDTLMRIAVALEIDLWPLLKKAEMAARDQA